MKKKKTVLSILSLLFAGVIISASLALGGNASGSITSLNVSNPMATIQGSTDGGSLWLAYTVRWKDGVEKDYKPMKVKGSFTKTITFALRPQGLDEVIVCLWRDKVSSSKCAAKNGGTACKYCQKNGFHMEGRVGRKTGS